MSEAEDRMAEVLEMVRQAMDQLDLAVGKATRLPIRERLVVRDHILPPRNHLRSAIHALGRKLGEHRAPAPRTE
ncbi:MAG TPA: hypothetical protein VK399_13270 [Longimicrobiaceae bacterium]|jgi:hypothetical protein|nr:hypothetical protein [Longimicrobiaceae bacterium]